MVYPPTDRYTPAVCACARMELYGLYTPLCNRLHPLTHTHIPACARIHPYVHTRPPIHTHTYTHSIQHLYVTAYISHLHTRTLTPARTHPPPTHAYSTRGGTLFHTPGCGRTAGGGGGPVDRTFQPGLQSVRCCQNTGCTPGTTRV